MSPPIAPSTSTTAAISLNVVPARTGITWVKMGIKTFFKQPLALGGLLLISFVLTKLLSVFPIIGVFLALLVIPALNAGMFVAISIAEKNQFPMPSILFSSFKQDVKKSTAMLALGVIYLLGNTLLVTIFNLIFSNPTDAPLLLNGLLNEQVVNQTDFQIAVLVVIIIQLPLVMIFWHAPALVYWHGVAPLQALFFSFIACFRNFAALTVYFLVWLAIFILGALLLTLIGALFGSLQSAALFVLPFGLIMAGMIFSSLYFTFKDSFITENNLVASVVK